MAANMHLKEETNKDVLERCVLVTHLKMFTLLESIKQYFRKFGEVEKASFVHRLDRTYTRSCIVLMKDKADDKILSSNLEHKIYDGTVKLRRYEGMRAHGKLFEDRNIELDIITKGIPGASHQQRFEFIETMLHPDYHTIEFFDENESRIKITFDTYEHLAKAEKHMKVTNIVYEPYRSPSESKR